MTTLNATENLAVLKRSADKPAAEALAVLEQKIDRWIAAKKA